MEIIVCEIIEELPSWLTSKQREIAESIIDADMGEVVIIARRSDGDVQVFPAGADHDDDDDAGTLYRRAEERSVDERERDGARDDDDDDDDVGDVDELEREDPRGLERVDLAHVRDTWTEPETVIPSVAATTRR